MLNARWTLNTSRLDSLTSRVDSGIDSVVNQAADHMVEHIQDSWSSTSPSSPYTAPAVVTGRLNASVKKMRGRNTRGQFASYNNAAQVSVIVDSAYAAALEFGYSPRNLAPRPFFFNGMDAAKEIYGDLVRGLFHW